MNEDPDSCSFFVVFMRQWYLRLIEINICFYLFHDKWNTRCTVDDKRYSCHEQNVVNHQDGSISIIAMNDNILSPITLAINGVRIAGLWWYTNQLTGSRTGINRLLQWAFLVSCMKRSNHIISKVACNLYMYPGRFLGLHFGLYIP